MDGLPIRQGDILLVPVDKIPQGAKREPLSKEGIVVAEGEATGHHHRIKRTTVSRRKDRSPEVRAFTKGKTRYIHVPAGVKAELSHEEHETLAIPPGDHKVVTQREYVAPRPQAPARTARVWD